MDNNEDRSELVGLAASGLVSAAVLAALIGKLGELGLLKDSDVREIYDEALLLIEQQQGGGSRTDDIYEPARRIIEDRLRRL